jgi:cytochrome d ubiquinol oxidase subunit I
MAAMVGTLAITLVILGGHSQAQHMVESQPMKMAAAEALWTSEDPASFSLLTIGDLSQRREVFSIRLPRLLSLLSYNQLSGEVRGIFDLQADYERIYGPGNYIPPVAVIYWSFRAMVGAGFALLALALYALFLVMGDALDQRPGILKLYLWAIALPYLANTAGWILTEIGRVPWVVFGLLRLEDAVSPHISVGMMVTSLLGYTLIYAALMTADVYLLVKYARRGPSSEEESGEEPPLTLEPSLIGGRD